MASASSSLTKQLTSASNVHFQMADCIIQFNNRVALLKSDHPSYKKLFEFLKKSHIFVALTNLSHLENPLTFNLEVFSSVIGLKSSESFVNLPKKETVKEGLATLGLFDETKPSLTSFDLINSSPLHPETGKHERKPNIFYTRYLSLVMEHLIKENYKNDKLLSLKPYKITFVTLRTPLENETPLNAHMCNVAEISPHPLQSLIPPFGEVNVDDSTNKSLSGISMQPLTEELVVSANETKSLDVSESTGAQENQNETAEAKKVLNTIVEENIEEKEKDKDHSSDIPTIEQLLDESFQASQIAKDAEVTLIRSRPMDMDVQTAYSEFELESIPDDDLQSLLGFKTSISDSSHDVSHLEHTSWEKTASDEFQSLSEHLDHVFEEVSLLHYKVEEMKSSIAQKVSNDIKSSVPDLISHSPKAQLTGLLSDALKNYLCQLLKESLTTLIPFALTKVLKTEIGDYISSKVSLGMQDVRKDLISQTKHLSKYCLSFQDMHSQLQEVRSTLEAAVIVDDHAEQEKSKECQMDENANPATTQGEHSNVEKMLLSLMPFRGSTNYDELDKEPLSKKFKIMTLIPNFPSPTPFFSPAPLKEPSPLRDPAKGKGVDMEEPVNILVPFMDEGGSNPKMPMHSRKNWSSANHQDQLHYKFMKKANNEDHQSKSIDSLLQSLNSKSQWVLNRAKNLGLPPPPALASFEMTVADKKRKRMETLKEVFVKERIDVDGTQRNITPPSGVVGKEDSPEAREMYKIMEIEIESRDDVDKAREILRTSSHELGILNIIYIQIGGDCWADSVPMDSEIMKESLSGGLRGNKGLSECKASESNIRRIRVKDIVKEAEDYLKTYSSAGMDISCWVDFLAVGCKFPKIVMEEPKEMSNNKNAEQLDVYNVAYSPKQQVKKDIAEKLYQVDICVE
ncbi:hypothetical protein Tco_1568715 [Tanacetum coccineum]